MKLARTDKDDVAGFYNSGLGINRNDAAAFFYYNDLHVVMPVKRNLCEVQRDGAQIGIVWKLDADVFFSFMEVFKQKKTDETKIQINIKNNHATAHIQEVNYEFLRKVTADTWQSNQRCIE